jgi:hypothetical protein
MYLDKDIDITNNIIKYLRYEIDYYIYKSSLYYIPTNIPALNKYESIYLDLCNKLDLAYDDLNDDETFIIKINSYNVDDIDNINNNIYLIDILNRYIDNKCLVYKYI